MQRGDVVTIAAQGDFGKPRPAVIVQSNALAPMIDSVLVCPFTTETNDGAYFRAVITPTETNGLRARSYAMADKTAALRPARIGPAIGRLSAADMARINAALAFALGLAD